MEITRHQEGEVLELRVAGRLDAYWADHLSNELQEAIRGGGHQIRLDFSGVTFLSSAGLRVLLTGYQQLSAIQGSLSVIRPSPGVQQVLELAGFDELLVAEPPSGEPGVPSEAGSAGPQFPAQAGPSIPGAGSQEPGAARAASSATTLDRETAHFEVFPLAPGATLRCRLVGDEKAALGSPLSALGPTRASDSRLAERHAPALPESREPRAESGSAATMCHPIAFSDGMFGLGVGAPGSDFAECRERFGEFLAVAGSAAYLPTDGTNVPDYLVAAGSFVPELQVLHGLICEGELALLTRFEGKEEPGRVMLSQLVDACLEMAGSQAAGIVVVAQSAGLVGAALRRSPALGGAARGPGPSSWVPGFPEIRQWLSFTPERAHGRSLVLLAGVAARDAGVGATHASPLRSMLRPLGNDSRLAGHFHAAAFSYRPLQRGELDLKTTVSTLFEAETLQGVLHLLNDDRPIVGAGESEFVRGACWVSPITDL